MGLLWWCRYSFPASGIRHTLTVDGQTSYSAKKTGSITPEGRLGGLSMTSTKLRIKRCSHLPGPAFLVDDETFGAVSKASRECVSLGALYLGTGLRRSCSHTALKRKTPTSPRYSFALNNLHKLKRNIQFQKKTVRVCENMNFIQLSQAEV